LLSALWVAMASAWGAPCEKASVLDLESATSSASQAFAALDLGAFEKARDEALGVLPCLDERITGSVVAGYYRVLAMDAFIAQDLDAAEAAFGAAILAYPSYRLPSNVAPRNHPLRQRYEAAAVREWEVPAAVPVPLEATLLIHGRHQLEHSEDRPTVVQLLDAQGEVSWTEYIAVGAQIPEYEAAPEDMRSQYLEQRVIMAPPHRHPYALAVASGTLLVSSLTMLVGASASRATFDDVETPYDDLASLRGRINGLNIGSAVTGVGGVALGTVAVVRW